MLKNLLVVFARTPTLGKVKTRNAKEMGVEKALSIYSKLLEYTLKISKASDLPYKVYLSEFPITQPDFQFEIQQGSNLGDKMKTAFLSELDKYEKVVLIGSDCLDISANDITNAFQDLDRVDLVIGPAVDGGYYLIGMKKPYNNIFSEIPWGTSEVLAKTLEKCSNSNISVHLLRELNDIDYPEDLPASWL